MRGTVGCGSDQGRDCDVMSMPNAQAERVKQFMAARGIRVEHEEVEDRAGKRRALRFRQGPQLRAAQDELRRAGVEWGTVRCSVPCSPEPLTTGGVMPAYTTVGSCGCQRARVTPSQCGCDCNRSLRPTGRMTVVPCRTNACGASTALWPQPVTEWNSNRYVLAGPPTVAGGSYGVRWMEFNRRDQLVTKEKDFASDAKRAAFVKKLEEKDNFHSFLSWSDPRDEEPEPPVVGGGFGGFSVALGTVDMGLLSASAFQPRGGQIDPVTWQPGMAPGHVRIPGYYTSPVAQEQWGQSAPTWGSAAAVAASLNRAYVGWPWSQLGTMLMRQWQHLQWTPVAEGSAEAQQAGTSPGRIRVVVLGDGRISRFLPG